MMPVETKTLEADWYELSVVVRKCTGLGSVSSGWLFAHKEHRTSRADGGVPGLRAVGILTLRHGQRHRSRHRRLPE